MQKPVCWYIVYCCLKKKNIIGVKVVLSQEKANNPVNKHMQIKWSHNQTFLKIYLIFAWNMFLVAFVEH